MERTRFSRCPAPLKETYEDVIELKCFRKLIPSSTSLIAMRCKRDASANTHILKRLQILKKKINRSCILHPPIYSEMILLEMYCINFFSININF